MHDRILLATGGETGAEEAIEHAVDLADVYDCILHVVYVVDEAIYSAYAEDEFIEDQEGPRSTLEKRGEKALAAVVEQADERDVPTETTIRYGRPAEEIVAEADELDANPLILGSRTKSDEYRSRVGSVADEVVRRTDRSVTVVKTPVLAQ